MADILEALFMASRPGRNYYSALESQAKIKQQEQRGQLINSALASFGLAPQGGEPIQRGNQNPALGALAALAGGGDENAFNTLLQYQLDAPEKAMQRKLQEAQLVKAEKDLKSPTVNTAVGKINADLASGAITQEEAAQLLAKETALTEGQSNAALYSDRMKAAMDSIDQFGDEGTSIVEKGLSALPFGNFMVSDKYQQLDQARRDFTNAVLRRESGAAISDAEFENANKQYFPQPGDSKAVIEQKKKNREIAYEGIRRAGGTAAPKAGQTTKITPEQALAELKRRGKI